jgi:hypothetical protein
VVVLTPSSVEIYDKSLTCVASSAIDSNKLIKNNSYNDSRYVNCGHPRVVHACLTSRLIFVGFSTGNVSLSSIDAFNFEYLNLDDIHGAEITALTTLGLSEYSKEGYVSLVIADLIGVVSVWQINSKAEKRQVCWYIKLYN